MPKISTIGETVTPAAAIRPQTVDADLLDRPLQLANLNNQSAMRTTA